MYRILTVLILFFTLLAAGIVSAQDEVNEKFYELTLEKIFLNPEFTSKGSGVNSLMQSMKDGIHYSAIDEGVNLNIYDYETGNKINTILSGDDFLAAAGKSEAEISSYYFSPDESKILISTDAEKVYRYSTISNFYVWDIAEKKLTFLTSNGKARRAEFSPDSRMVCLVRANNIFIIDIEEGTETQVTKDGEKNKIINGIADWVCEEELGISKAFDWSPDASRLAYMRFDESKVKEYDLTFYGELYPELFKYKYPKAGEDISVVTVHIYDVAEKKTVRVDVGPNPDQYIARIKFTREPNILSVTRLSRLQNKLDILFADAVTGASRVILTEENKYYISESYDLTFLKDNSFLRLSDKDGYAHIYHHSADGREISQVTKGEWEVASLKGVDEEKKLVYYISHEISPLNKDIYCINPDGTGKKRISERPGSSNAEFSKGFKYYILSNNQANIPPYYELRRGDGSLVKVMQDNLGLRDKMKDYNFTKKEFFKFNTSQDVELNGYMIKPSDFDEAKKYPVLMYVYAGPGSQSVTDSWGGNDYIWYQLLCKNGYIVACVDGRGTGARGSEFEKQVYRRMGELELKDQIEGAKYLGSLPYIDAGRIGIWGWSFGGYMSTLCITAGADYPENKSSPEFISGSGQVFKTAVAVAPVTSFRYYDNIYTERYLGLPKDNPAGYDSNSSVAHASELKGKLLIVHGATDDNVHLQNTMEFVNALVKANKQFEMQIYTNRNHNISGGNTRYHLYKRITDFILKNL
jgi:dipeptidyl-peptidase-4